MHYSRVSADITYELSAPAPLDVLSKVAAAKNAAEALDSYQPPHAAYKALRKKLAEARGRKGDAGPGAGRARPGARNRDRQAHRQTVLMQDERVPMLRERLGLPAVRDDLFYDKPLADAVAQFQKEKGLPATGRLTSRPSTPSTASATSATTSIIMANMERWRWVPRDLGKAHVVLNIPDFTLRVYNNGAQVWTTRVVVGKPARRRRSCRRR